MDSLCPLTFFSERLRRVFPAPLPPTVRFVLFALVQVLAYRAMEWIPFLESEATPVWIPTGVALFFLIWWGIRYWPAMLTAELIMSLPLHADGFVEALVNTAEVTLAAYLFVRIFKSRERLYGVTGILGAVVLGGVITPACAGLVLRWVRMYCGVAFASSDAVHIKQWIIGDYNGILLILPALVGFACVSCRRRSFSLWRGIELVSAVVALIFCAGLVFDFWERWGFDLNNEILSDAFLLTPFLVWIAFRFAQPWTSLSFFACAMVAIWQTVHGEGPIAHRTYEGRIEWLQMFIAVGGTLSVLLAASRQEMDAAEERLRDSADNYRLLFMHNPHPMWVFDRDTLRFLEVNEAAVRKYGYSRDEFLEMTIQQIRPPEELPKLSENLKTIRSRNDDFGLWRHRTKDGTILDVEVTSCGFEKDGRALRLILAADVTEKKRLEGDLRQAQKLEALGRLAGGVAHDFNNLLMIISSYAEMLECDPVDHRQVTRNSGRIRQATERGAALTQQLLAFSRKQVLAPKVIHLNTALRDILSLAERLIGEDVELRFVPGEARCAVKIDPDQLTHVVLNLCSNARDAMGGEGVLTIETATVDCGARHLGANGELPAGRYITVRVGDSGPGIEPEVQEHIFEPFFTTKERGKGTGLGLATVYGIVRQSGGYIDLRSMPGHGSEFTLFFPPASEDPVEPLPSRGLTLETGSESVLVVEDEAELRAAIVDSLRSLGYKVSSAVDGLDAIDVLESLSSLDVLVTDVVMPRMAGTEVLNYVRAKFPATKVLLMSGYANGSVDREQLGPDTIFVPKPLSLATLARNLRALLSARVTSSSCDK